MTIPTEYLADADAMPAVLRALLEAELAAGNTIVEVGHTHPAPPVGAYFLLARPVSTRPRASGVGLSFDERKMSHHSGEFTDAKRFFFILDPPLPPEPEPDMDVIRAEMQARQCEADRKREAKVRLRSHAFPGRESDRVARFRASMELDYERWKEGTSYDLDAIKDGTPEERESIESILVSRGVCDWRDVEALAALGTPRADTVLRETLLHGSREYGVAVLRHAPHLASGDERTVTLVEALQTTSFFHGLTGTLLEVQAHHPPAVIDALLRGVLQRHDGVQVHFAAMLMFLHGKATSAFDWDQRPFFLKFNTHARAEREALFCDLCVRIGADPERHLSKPGAPANPAP
jgi:hypothetical protein